MILLGNKLVIPQYIVSRAIITLNKSETMKPLKGERIAAISFKNVGTAAATVNGLQLLVGDPLLTFDGDLGMMDNTTYSVNFATTAGAKIEVVKTIVDDIKLVQVEIPFVQPR